MDPIHTTDEHRILREQVRRFVENEVVPYGNAWELEGKVPREVYRRMGELGFLGMRCPVEYGGSDLDALAMVVFAEELAKCTYGGFTMSIMVHTDMASPHLVHSGTEEQLARYVPGVISGEIITAIAVTEPDAGSDVQGLRTAARRHGNGWMLNGAKVFITNGVYGNLLIVAARTDLEAKPSRGTSMFLVDTDTPGVTIAKKLDKMGWRCSDTAELVFEDVKLPADALLGEQHRGFYEIMKNFQNERLAAAAIYVGEATKALELTLDYVNTRKAFGGVLWDKQAIRQRLAMLAGQVEAFRHLVYHTAWMDSKGADCVKEVSMAKAWGGELVNKVLFACQQFHGGFGYMREAAIERMVRDGRVHTIGGGATEVMLEEVAKRMV
ncbi:MAG: acyl-CoA dehydrogenase family protein [Gammaproteobacteria bacterium]|nr:acyl-CoA dehydrogenase family protein [Gammaproteobacteria bacterium]